MANQAKIYHDPWHKTSLEGTAQLCYRIPDTPGTTHHGITCQRWLVRFLPDQDLTARWLDVADIEPYILPTQDSNQYAFSRATLLFDIDEWVRLSLKVGEVEARYVFTDFQAGYVLPRAGRLSALAYCYTTANATGGAALAFMRPWRDGTPIFADTMTDSTTIGGPYTRHLLRPDIIQYNAGQVLTLSVDSIQPEGEGIQLTKIIATIEINWGEFA